MLAACGLVYGSLLAFRAPDLRGVIAYSSLAQMGLIILGLFAVNDLGLNGAVLQMVNHGLISATLFLLAGGIERRAATGELAALGGMARGRPALATVLMTAGVIALAVPGSTAFAGEFAILAGVFQTGWGYAVVGAVAIVLAAMYMLRLISAVLHQSPGPAVSPAALDLRPAELGVLVPLVALLLVLSAWPAAITDRSFLRRRRLERRRSGVQVILAALNTPHIDWLALSAPLALLGAGGVNLLAAVLVPRRAQRIFAAIVCALGFAGAIVAASILYAHSAGGHGVIADAIQRDRLAALAAIIVAGSGILAIGTSYSEPMADDHIAEYYALLAWAGAGMIFLASASTLLTLFLGLEWFSISLYILCAIDRDLVGSLEAGLKYLIIGGFGSAILLFGSALVYGATGSLEFHEIARVVQAQNLSHDGLLVAGLALVIGGLGFKASAAPFHMWTPDVYEGAPTPVTAFMSAATKTVALVLTMRVLVTAFPQEARLWTVTVAAIACLSLAVGNLAALVQRGVKRMLAYSSISHAGFMLIAVAANNGLGGRALLYYLIPYSAMSVGAFAVVAARERELNRPVTLDNLAGFGWERPLLGISMMVFMLGFAGPAADRRLRRQVLRLRRRVPARLDLARDRRRRRDRGQPLLLPRRDQGDVHAARRGAAAGARGRLAAARAGAPDDRRGGARRHRRVVLRRAAADRRREARGELAAVLAAPELCGQRGDGLHAEDHQAGEQGRAGQGRHRALGDRRRAHRCADDDQREHNRPEQRVQVVASTVEQRAEGVERHDRRSRHRQEQRVERKLVRPCPVRRRGRHHESDRNRPTRHAGGFFVRPSAPSLPSPNP